MGTTLAEDGELDAEVTVRINKTKAGEHLEERVWSVL